MTIPSPGSSLEIYVAENAFNNMFTFAIAETADNATLVEAPHALELWSG